ncbi:MAG TPA: endonuclease/exonuclease/phosphatase family protein [Baekduia sp.]|nr:endonuclease/exonuclease/phosphatase family protein [Baekduia sp.]
MLPRSAAPAVLAAAAALSLAAPAAAPAKPHHRDVTVMTRNFYLGADLIPLATQPTLDAFEQAAATRFQTVLSNDFHVRAKGLAAGIAKAKPDLVGIQEGAIWKQGSTSAPSPATHVVYDSIKLVRRALKARGLHYKVAAKRPWFDFEAPTSLGYDVRLIQQDVILKRVGKGSHVKIRHRFTGGYAKTFDVPTQVGVVRSDRGWVGVDAALGKRRFRFVTTHLEAYSPEIAQTQMQQLLQGPLHAKKRQTILVGDFNSDPKDVSGDRGAQRAPSAYGAAIDAGFANPFPRRETCCFAEDLHDTSTPLTQWIDHIIVRPKMKLLRSGIVGSKPSERVGGLWPSDHAGIYGTLRLR